MKLVEITDDRMFKHWESVQPLIMDILTAAPSTYRIIVRGYNEFCVNSPKKGEINVWAITSKREDHQAQAYEAADLAAKQYKAELSGLWRTALELNPMLDLVCVSSLDMVEVLYRPGFILESVTYLQGRNVTLKDYAWFLPA